MISIYKLKNRKDHNQLKDNQNSIYSQYMQEYKYYFNNTINKCKYKDKYSDKAGECIILDVSAINQTNGDEKYITTLPNSGLEIGSVLYLTFAKDLTECWIIEDKENLPIPSHDKFKISPLYFPAIVIHKNGKKEDIDTKVVNNDVNFLEKKIYYSPLTKIIRCGDYIKYKDDLIYLIKSVQNFISYPCGKGLFCNQILKWKDEKGIHENPCVIENDGYGVKTNATNDIQNAISAKSKIYVQYNDYTKTIKSDYRFCFNHNESDIYKVLDVTTSMIDGIITITCEKTEYLPMDDDLENNLAYNGKIKNNEDTTNESKPEVPNDYKIDGVDKFKQKTQTTFTINPMVDNSRLEVDSIDIQCDTVKVISQDNGTITLYGNPLYSDTEFTLYAYVGDKKVASKVPIVSKR